MNARRVLGLVFPWFILGRVRSLAESPTIYPLDPAEASDWDRGYERAMWEIRLNLGIEDEPRDGGAA